MKFIKLQDIPIDDIEDNPFYPRQFEEFDTEDIKRMTKSFEKSGLLNAIIVREVQREINNENKIKYQMIAGQRRKKAYQLAGKKLIQARIIEADDIEVQIISLIENYHRKDLTVSEKEKYIYKLWNNGNEKGIFHNNLSIMEDWTGVPHQVLSDIINAGKEKEKDESEVIQLSTSKDLQRTRALKNVPEIRKLLLEGVVIKKTIKALELENLVKIIKKGKEDGFENNILSGIVELSVEQKLIIGDIKNIIEFIIVLNKEDQQNIIEKLKRDSKSLEGKLNIFGFKNFIDTYVESSDDVKQKLLYNNISIKEAKELNKFKARDQREKVLTDLKLYDNKIREIEKEKYRYLQKRSKQAQDLEEQGEDLFNLDEEDLDKKKFKVPEEDELKLVDKIVKIKKELLYFDIERINKLNISTNRNFAIEFLWEIYNRFHGILVDLGEITADYNIKKEKPRDEFIEAEEINIEEEPREEINIEEEPREEEINIEEEPINRKEEDIKIEEKLEKRNKERN